MVRQNNIIGGYFALEINGGGDYWPEAVRLNTARNCLRYIIRNYKIQTLYVPSYTCPVVWEAVRSERCGMRFYSIDHNFLPQASFPTDAYILYTNYLGVCSEKAVRLAQQYPRLIVDCSQSFYSSKLGLASFNSARKFFGVPDGAYLFMDWQPNVELERDISMGRVSHLLARTEHGAEAGYPMFRENEEVLCGEDIKAMSRLTHTILQGIEYQSSAQKRRANYSILEELLGDINELSCPIGEQDVPMAFPFFCRKKNLREKLISKKIFIPTYWTGQLDAGFGAELELFLLPLPIDQRYGPEDMEYIRDCIYKSL